MTSSINLLIDIFLFVKIFSAKTRVLVFESESWYLEKFKTFNRRFFTLSTVVCSINIYHFAEKISTKIFVFVLSLETWLILLDVCSHFLPKLLFGFLPSRSQLITFYVKKIFWWFFFNFLTCVKNVIAWKSPKFEIIIWFCFENFYACRRTNNATMPLRLLLS